MRTLVDDRARDKEIGQWVCEKIDAVWEDGNHCLAVEKFGEFYAGVMFNEWNGSNISAHLRVDHPYGLTRELLQACFGWAFNVRGAKRVTAPCGSNNSRVLQLLKKMGFKCEAILENFCVNEHYVVMVMWPQNCKFLENSNG